MKETKRNETVRCGSVREKDVRNGVQRVKEDERGRRRGERRRLADDVARRSGVDDQTGWLGPAARRVREAEAERWLHRPGCLSSFHLRPREPEPAPTIMGTSPFSFTPPPADFTLRSLLRLLPPSPSPIELLWLWDHRR